MNDTGAIVLGWLTKLVATFALLGLIAFDGVAVGAGTFQTADHASTAAVAAADAYHDTKDLQQAYAAALASAIADGGTVAPQDVSLTGNEITVTVHEDVTTIWVHKIGALKRFTTLKATSTSNWASR